MWNTITLSNVFFSSENTLKQLSASFKKWGEQALSPPPYKNRAGVKKTHPIDLKISGMLQTDHTDLFWWFWGLISHHDPSPLRFLSHTLQNWDNFGLKSGKVDPDWLVSVQVRGCGAVNLQQCWQEHPRGCFAAVSGAFAMYYHAIWKYQLKLIVDNANSFFKMVFARSGTSLDFSRKTNFKITVIEWDKIIKAKYQRKFKDFWKSTCFDS